MHRCRRQRKVRRGNWARLLRRPKILATSQEREVSIHAGQLQQHLLPRAARGSDRRRGYCRSRAFQAELSSPGRSQAFRGRTRCRNPLDGRSESFHPRSPTTPKLLRTRYELGTNFWQTLKGPYSAVSKDSKPILATIDLFFKFLEICRMCIILHHFKLKKLSLTSSNVLLPISNFV